MIKAKPPSGVSLLYLHEQNVEEIVSGTGLSASNVKVKLHRSRRKLFEILNQHLKEEVWTPQKNERDADKLLRDLFNEAGQFTAPEGLDARILQRIAASPKIAIMPEEPLLPKYACLVAIPIAVGNGFIPSGNAFTSWFDRIPWFDWSVILASPWLIMGLASSMVLLGLDIWLNRKPSALTAR